MNISEEKWKAYEWHFFFNGCIISSKTTSAWISFFRGEMCLSQCRLHFDHPAEVLLWEKKNKIFFSSQEFICLQLDGVLIKQGNAHS